MARGSGITTPFLNNICGRCVTKLSTKVGYDIKVKIGNILLNARYIKLLEQESGDLLKTVNEDTSNVCEFLEGSIIHLFSQGIMAISAFTYLIFIDPILALVTFITHKENVEEWADEVIRVGSV